MFKKNFDRICVDKGEKPTIVVRDIGLSASTYTHWTDDTVPRKATLQKLADRLGVTVSDLLDDPAPTDRMLRLPINERTISDEEYEIIVAMRRQPETIPFIRRLLSLPEAEKKKAES